MVRSCVVLYALFFYFLPGRYFLFREYKKNAFSVICTLRAFLRQKLYVRNRGLKLLEGLPVDFGRGAGGLAVELGAIRTDSLKKPPIFR